MIIIRSLIDGKILGFALDMEVATTLAEGNDWPAWYATEEPELTVKDPVPGTDPYNRRGMNL